MTAKPVKRKQATTGALETLGVPNTTAVTSVSALAITSASASASAHSQTRRAWALHCSRLAMVFGASTGLAFNALGASPAAPNKTSPRTLLVVGDSLSAEYGLKRGSGWVALMEQRIQEQKLAWQVVNASISGETTSGGRSRMASLLARHEPHVVLIELGGNDALRGLPLKMTEDNLQHMAKAAKSSGAQVLIAGIAVPPNYGRSYSENLMALFGNVARAEAAALVPFILAGIADVPNAETWFQSDRIHPTEQAQPKMLDNVWPVLRPLLLAK